MFSVSREKTDIVVGDRGTRTFKAAGDLHVDNRRSINTLSEVHILDSVTNFYSNKQTQCYPI